ncbi:MAG: alpha/beta hydrolase fold protein [Frankiales bacterium]|nr:alpha/beta hydrolase fold protein [Frankiales bacterium]
MITTSDGVQLHVRDEGAGRPVVLLPGYGAAGTGWHLQVAALRGGHRVVSVDRRSHGRSDCPEFGQRMSRHGKDVADVLDALELDDVLLVGSSMGANVALAYVDLFGTSRLRGLVLVDQTPKMVNEGDWQLGFHGLTRGTLDAWVTAFPDGLNPFHRLPPLEVLAPVADGPEFSVDGTRALLRDHAEADWRDVVARAAVPLVAVAGRHSPTWPCDHAAWMAEAAPFGECHVFEDSGHVPFLEEPDGFNALLLEVAAR